MCDSNLHPLLLLFRFQRIFRDLAAVSKPAVNWTVLYKLKENYGVDGCERENSRFVEEAKKTFPEGSLKVASRVLTKIVDEEKVAEGSCTIC